MLYIIWKDFNGVYCKTKEYIFMYQNVSFIQNQLPLKFTEKILTSSSELKMFLKIERH